MEHGTYLTYRQGCRCDACRAAMSAYKKQVYDPTKVGKSVDHGYVGYAYGCRCETCTKGHSSYQMEHRAASPVTTHGVRQGFLKGCRCQACRDANNEYQRAWAKRRRENRSEP